MSAQSITPEPIPAVPTSQGLISIERVVAFVIGPIVVAASGTISAAAIKWGFNVTPKMVEGAFITGGLTAGAAVWKWLQGRQKTPILLNDGKHLLNTVSGVVEDLGITHDQQASVERQVLGVLEEHAHDLANLIAGKIQMAGSEIHITNPGPAVVDPTGSKTSSVPAETVEPIESAGNGAKEPSETPVPDEPIQSLEEAGDPAPATPIPGVPPIPPTAPVSPLDQLTQPQPVVPDLPTPPGINN